VPSRLYATVSPRPYPPVNTRRRLHRFTCLLALVFTPALLMVAAAQAQNGRSPLDIEPPTSRIDQPINLPDMGEPADLELSPAQEAKIADEVVSEFYRGGYLVNDVELDDYINTIGWRLATQGSGSNAPPHFRFFLIADDRINAFAVPGGVLGLNAGLLLAADNESELAGVMGHEQAHVTQRHLARSANDTKTATMATYLAMIAAIIAGSANPNMIAGALALGQTINYQREVNYTRAHELEADRIGIRTMAEAGYDPEAMATFFGKLEQQTRLYGSQIPEILLTHPVNTTRIAEARERADRMPKKDVHYGPEFQLMQARVRVLAADGATQAVDEMASRIKGGDKTLGTQYGYAFALLQAGRASEALPVLAPVLAALPRQINVSLLQAQLLSTTGKPAEAQAILNRLVALYPRSAPALIGDAQSMLDNGRPAEARALLLTHDQAYGTRVETYRLLAEASRQLNNVADAQFQMATYEIERGDLRAALSQIDAGLRLSSLKAQDRARLQAMRDQIIDRIPRKDLAEMGRDQRRQVR
jgi:beta-barrel assembly-enhancing protease